MAELPEVPFDWIHNADRSQMAAPCSTSTPASATRLGPPEPAGLTLDQIRPIRDEIAARVRASWPS